MRPFLFSTTQTNLEMDTSFALKLRANELNHHLDVLIIVIQARDVTEALTSIEAGKEVEVASTKPYGCAVKY